MKKNRRLCGVLALAVGVCWSVTVARGGARVSVSLNGDWQIEESVGATEMPSKYVHTVPVPGLVNLARPAFPGVDLFASQEYLKRFGRKYPWGSTNLILATNAPLPAIGISVQKRNYFWYQKSFTAPAKREVALLKISKAQFGTRVWLNGREVGESLSCWTESTFNLTDAINWKGENRLLVRIGAHPAVLPEKIPGAGSYSSKHKWTPGIYDDVSLVFCDNPVIESIQVAPRIGTSEVVIQTKVRNYGVARDFELGHLIRSWKEGKEAGQVPAQGGKIGASEEQTYTQTNRLANARLWSPEDPFLYVVETRTGGDSVKTRFGMREYRFDNKAGVGYLNGKPYYLRGGNIELWLHAEDPLCGDRPWDRAWVRKLIAEIPKKLNWNAFRFCLSPVPKMWLDIADEEGIMVQLEPIVWGYHKEWDDGEMVSEYGRWMRDNWNHPCVFMWDSSNETGGGKLPKIVNTVRPLDLSGRAWDNSWSPPAGPDDPSEVHPYLLIQKPFNKDYRHFNDFDAGKTVFNWLNSWPGHCRIINEYCWLWLYPDGTPVGLVGHIPKGTAGERREYRWYLTGALTEMWRAQRCAVGVFYYVYLGSYLPRQPGPYHFGAFDDLLALRLQPEFEKYMTEAFRPLGVYLKFWGEGEPGEAVRRDSWAPIKGGGAHSFTVMMVNDDPEPVSGKLVLSVETLEGKTLASAETPFGMEGVGKGSYELSLAIPLAHGKYLLKATAYPDGTRYKSPTVSCRKISVEPVK